MKGFEIIQNSNLALVPDSLGTEDSITAHMITINGMDEGMDDESNSGMEDGINDGMNDSMDGNGGIGLDDSGDLVDRMVVDTGLYL